VTSDTTIVWGAEDHLVPVETLDAWLEALPHAKPIVIPDAGHLPHIEQTDRFLSAIDHITAPESTSTGTK
jgi:pimeloyl-ACP methyl ester carboxylesterase